MARNLLVILLYIGLQVLCPHHCTAHEDWSPATANELHRSYLPDELCAVRPHQKAGTAQCEGQHNSALLRQCHVGFVRKNIWANPEPQQKKTCLSRGFKNRSSLLFSWKHVGDAGAGKWSIDGNTDENEHSLARGLFSRHLVDREDSLIGGLAEEEGVEEEGREKRPRLPPPSHVPITTQNIVLLGDSVSSQLAQFLICDLLREESRAPPLPAAPGPASATSIALSQPRGGGGVAAAHSDEDEGAGSGGKTDEPHNGKRSNKVVQTFNRTVANFWVPLSRHQPSGRASTVRLGLLRIHNQQFNLPCLQNNRSGKCFVPKEQAVFDHVTHLLAPFIALQPTPPQTAASHTHTMIIFNYGLHIHRKYMWTMKPMLAALLQQASALPQQYVSFYFRESSSQSFTGSPGGYFKHGMPPPPPGSFCCSEPAASPPPAPALSPPSSPSPLHHLEWRNRLAQEQLRSLDSHWRRHIHWLPFFNTSAALYDLRAEWNEQTSLPDCTHLMYSPLAYHALWRTIHTALAG